MSSSTRTYASKPTGAQKSGGKGGVRAPSGLKLPGYRTMNAGLLQRKCACGGTCSSCRGDHEEVQTKLRVSQPGDRYEQEADRTADTVMRMAAGHVPTIGKTGTGSLQRQPEEDKSDVDKAGDFVDEEFGIDRKASPAAGTPKSSAAIPFSGGSPLSSGVQSFYESRFGRDFSAVRVHVGPAADESAQSLNARAYTHQNNIVFRSGEYAPSSPDGGWLLAHELTHVAQQGFAPAHTAAKPRPTTNVPEAMTQRYGDVTLPTAQRIDQKYAEGLTLDELEQAIAQLTAEIDLHISTTPENIYLQDNLNLLTAERDHRQQTDVPFDEREFDVDDEDWSLGTALHAIVRGDPANLRPGPSKESTPATPLPMNTRLVIESEKGSWYQVKTESGNKGWITKELVETNVPDPDASLHIVQAGETAQKIAQKYYGPHAKEWGQDERFFVNVLFYVNEGFPAQRGSKGIYRPAEAMDDWAKTVVVQGSRIWIPGVDAALALKGVVPTGSVSYETWQTVKEVFIGGAAFIFGLLEGALESIVDVFVGLWDLIKMAWAVVKSLITGEILSDIKKLISDISKLSVQEILDAGIGWFKSKWFAEGTWDRWRFRGWLIGYVIVEILMLIFSGGAATALKWAGKTGKLAKIIEKFPTLVKLTEKAKKFTGPAADALRAGAKALSAAHTWAMSVLRIPLEIIKDTAGAALERLKKLPDWIQQKFKWLSPGAMKRLLGCASPCAVDIHAIEAYFKGLAPAIVKGAKKLTAIDEIVAALPKGMDTSLIRKKLASRPALKKLIETAELTDVDLVKMADFITPGDMKNPAMAYRTFVRYLTSVTPIKAEGDIAKFNKIAEAIVKADVRQGAALKGSMFEQFAKIYVPELGGKSFAKVTFQRSASLKLSKPIRTADNFVADTGAIWDMKHGLSKVPLDQADDYAKLIGQLTPDGKEVKTVNYLFAAKEAADANVALKARAGFNVYFIDAVTKAMVKL